MPPSPRKRPWSRPLADLVGQAIDPVLARQGFSESDLILHWDDIVGEHLAANSRPIKLQWPPRPAGQRADAPLQPAALIVRVEGAFALELQHRSGEVLGRINAHLGWRCVGKLVLKQGPLERTPAAGARHKAPSAAAVAAAAAATEGIVEPALQDALTRLGARVHDAASPVRLTGDVDQQNACAFDE